MAMELESESALQMKESHRHLAPFGFDFEHHPTESFREIAHDHSTIFICRFFNFVNLVRLFWLNAAYRHADILIQASVTEVSRNSWTEFQEATQKRVTVAADNILAMLPFYIYPDPANPQSPLVTMSVSPLLWALLSFSGYRSIAKRQQDSAKEALLQIGKRAKLPIATKIAMLFEPGVKIFDAGYIFHLA
jgi:hypothetical protein